MKSQDTLCGFLNLIEELIPILLLVFQAWALGYEEMALYTYLGLIAYNFEKEEQANYNMWETAILNKYYDAIYEDHNPFAFSQNSM